MGSMVVRNILLGTTKFFLGVFLALVVLALAGAATGRYFITRLSELPERPLFDNDAPAQPDQSAAAPPAAAPAEAPAQPAAQETTSDDPGLFKAVVTYPQGLLVREGPGFDYATLDGVGFDEQLTVLEEKDVWYRIRTAGGKEGWVKGKGNTRKVE